MSLRRERDSTILRIFTKYNLGSLPDAPFSNDVALNLTNRTKTRLLDVEKELQDKKVHIFSLYSLYYGSSKTISVPYPLSLISFSLL